MHPMKKYLAAFVFSAVLFACSPNNVTIDSSVVKMMDSAGVVGSFALLENGTGKFTIANLSHYKDSASSPLSSFFILPTLIALDKGIINHNQATWVSMDSTAYYQNIITQIGRQEILKNIDSIHYGKGVVSANLNEFWKDGSLKITADEQLGFIKKLFFKDLPFQKRSQEIFKKMMVKEENSNYTLSYLPATDSLTNNTWVLGYEEENTHIYFFVLHTTGKTAAASNNSVILLKKILLQQGFLQGLR
jgi:beta-lactamase class D